MTNGNAVTAADVDMICVDITTGYYCMSSGGGLNTTITLCPVGSYCPMASASPQLCAPGFFCPSSGMSFPYACSGGMLLVAMCRL